MKSSHLVAIGLLVSMAASADAQVIFSVDSGSQRTDGGKAVGVTFTSYGQTITALGFFDFGGDGLADSYPVALWDSAQNLIASATVTPSSPLIGDFRWVAIPAITLGTFANPEQFTIGALLPDVMNDVWLDQLNNEVLGAGFTGAGTGQFTNGGSLVYPTTFDSSSYYVVNGSDLVVPEPSTVALALAGVVGVVAFCRRRA